MLDWLVIAFVVQTGWQPIPEPVRRWHAGTVAWVQWLQHDPQPTCHVRVGTTAGAVSCSAWRPCIEQEEELEHRIGVPGWVIGALNRPHDLNDLQFEQLLVVPFPNRECVDPIRWRAAALGNRSR